MRDTPAPQKIVKKRGWWNWELARYAMGIAIAAGLIAAGTAAFRRGSQPSPTVLPADPRAAAPSSAIASPVVNVPPAPAAAPPANSVVARPPLAVPAPDSIATERPRTTHLAAQELRIARGMLQAGLHDQAFVKLNELVKSYPSTKEALDGYFLIAGIQQSRARVNDAIATYLEIADRFKGNPRAPEALFRMAQLTRQSDRDQRDAEARRILTSSVTQYPRSRWAPRALLTRAEIEDALRLSEDDAALGPAVPTSLLTYRLLVREYPKSVFQPIALLRLARGYEKLKKYRLAAEAFTDLAKMHPTGADEAWFKSAEIYRRYLKDVEKARVAYANVPAASRFYPNAQRQLKILSSRKPVPARM